MCVRILPLVISGFLTLTFADSAVQTDWSGGPGVVGPVVDWGNDFFMDTGSTWQEFPGELQCAREYMEILVSSNFEWARCVRAADIDADGDIDLIGAAIYIDEIAWFENIDGIGTVWSKHVIDNNFDAACFVHSADFDGDGDMDVLGVEYLANGPEYSWWENVAGTGLVWLEHVIEWDFGNVHTVHAGDMDNDGDLDVVGASYSHDDVSWWENLDGLGTNWVVHIVVDNTFEGAASILAADINNDGSMDIVGAAGQDDEITWWENLDGLGLSWDEHLIADEFDGAWSVSTADIDNDSDIDVVGAACVDDSITWWENSDGLGLIWVPHPIAGDFEVARSVYAVDVDCDGDMDVLGAAETDGIAWWENSDGAGTAWVEHRVDTGFEYARGVFGVDINQTGHIEVLGAGSDGISIWDLDDYSYNTCSVESSILDTESAPDWGVLDWNAITTSCTAQGFQVRASDTPDILSMGPWSDTLWTPCNLEGILTDGDRYVEYRAILMTTDPDSTPVLQDITISWNTVSIEDTAEPIPPGIALLPFSPNPSSLPAVRFSLPEPASVTLSIFDISGRLVTDTNGDDYSSGYHDLMIDELSPGIYFCRMISGDFIATQRFVVME